MSTEKFKEKRQEAPQIQPIEMFANLKERVVRLRNTANGVLDVGFDTSYRLSLNMSFEQMHTCIYYHSCWEDL
jgi:hypothetical protein